MYVRFSAAAEQSEVWDRFEAGQSMRSIARSIGRSQGCGSSSEPEDRRHPSARSDGVVRSSDVTGRPRGDLPGPRHRALIPPSGGRTRTGSLDDLSRGVRQRRPARIAIRHAMPRLRPVGRARRPRPAKLAQLPLASPCGRGQLEMRWSPQQIASGCRGYPMTRRCGCPTRPSTCRCSSRVEGPCARSSPLLRQGRAMRRPSESAGSPGPGHIPNMVMISERPAEVEDRAVPGHWEGDLLMGTGSTPSAPWSSARPATSCSCGSRGNGGEAVRTAMTEKVRLLPSELKRSITWDRGHGDGRASQVQRGHRGSDLLLRPAEPMATWDPTRTPTGLLRQYFPKGTDLSVHTQAELDAVARSSTGALDGHSVGRRVPAYLHVFCT